MRRNKFLLFMLSVILCWSTTSGAQEPSLSEEELQFSVTDLTKTIHESEEGLRTMKIATVPSEKLMAFFTMLPAWHDSLKMILKGYELATLSKMSMQRVEGMRSELQDHRMSINKYKDIMTSRLDVLQSNLNELNATKIGWKAIERKYKDDVAINEILNQRLQPLLTKIDESIEDYSSTQRKDLWYFSQINEISHLLTEKEGVIESRAKEIHNLIFEQSHPFWNLTALDFRYFINKKAFYQTFYERVNFVKRYIEFNIRGILFHLLGIIGLFFVLVVSRRRAESFFHEKKQERFLTIFHYPFSAAYFISFLLVLTFYAPYPRVVFELILISLVLPITQLVTNVINGYKKKVLSIFLVFFTLHLLIELFPLQSAFGRLVSFVYEASLSIGIISFLRNSKKLALSENLKFLLQAFSLLFIGILIAAMIFEVSGSVQISHLLRNGTVLNIGLAVVLYLWSFILKTMLILTLELPFIAKLQQVIEKKKDIGNRIFLLISAYLFWTFMNGLTIQYDINEELASWWQSMVSRSYEFGELQVSIQDFISFILVLIVTIVLAKFLKYLFGKEILPKLKLERGMPNAISTTIYYFIAVVGFFLAAASTGIQWGKVNLALGAVGVGVGFGLQNVIYNFISGLILIYERPIQVGDTIEFGSMMGPVTHIGVRSSKVLTYEGAEVIVPNGTLVSKEVINWTYTDQRKRRELIIKTTYGAKPNEVIAIIKEVLNDVENVIRNPEPLVLFTGFGDGTHDFRVLFWSQLDVGLSTESRAALAIYDALTEAGYDMPMQKSAVVLQKEESS